jgi:hypothetical protein
MEMGTIGRGQHAQIDLATKALQYPNFSVKGALETGDVSI